jgi:hypothetical protein
MTRGLGRRPCCARRSPVQHGVARRTKDRDKVSCGNKRIGSSEARFSRVHNVNVSCRRGRARWSRLVDGSFRHTWHASPHRWDLSREPIYCIYSDSTPQKFSSTTGFEGWSGAPRPQTASNQTASDPAFAHGGSIE